MANSFKQTQQEALALIREIETELSKLDAQFTNMASNLNKSFKAGGFSNISSQLSAINEQMSKFNNLASAQQTQVSKLSKARKTLNEKTREEVIDQRALRKEADLEAKSKSKVVGAYQRLNARRQQAKRILQDLIVTKGKDNAQTKKAQVEYDKYTNKLNQANKATSNFAKTGLGSAVRGLRNFIGAFGVILGGQMLVEYGRRVFETVKKLQSLDFALKTIVTNSKELARTQEFLSNTTNAYGADLISTTERYTKFLAAAKQSNVSMKDTEKIFSTVTKASGVLGLKTDELTGIYLALEQMLSKGKVTTEELRRQLGERLPGAFGIMADAIGVSVQELDKMLRAGEVLSADALPKFAIQLEKAYGIASVKKVDTLVAAQTRLENSFIEVARAFNETTGIDKGLISLFNGLSKVLDITLDLDRATERYSNSIASERSELNSLVIEITKTNKEEGERERLISNLVEKYPFFLKFLKEEKIDNENLINALNTVNSLYIKRLAIQRLSEKVNLEEKQNKLADAIIDNEQAIQDYNKALTSLNLLINKGTLDTDLASKSVESQEKTIRNYINTELERVNLLKANGDATETQIKNANIYEKALQALSFATRQYNKDAGISSEALDLENAENEVKQLEEALGLTAKQLEDLFSAYDGTEVLITASLSKQNDKHKEINKSLDEKSEKLTKLNSADYFDEQIKKLIEERDAVVDSAKEYAFYNQLIDDITKAKEKLTGATEDETDELKKQSEVIDQLANRLRNYFQSFKDEAMSNFGFNTLNELMTLEDNGMTTFDKLLEKAKETGTEFEFMFNTISEVGQEAFNFLNQNQEAYFEAQLYRLEQQRDIAIEFAGDSVSAREEIERQYEEKRREIQQKQAEAQKKQALFNIAIDTAQAIMSVIARSGSVLQGIAVGLIGAAQGALVASTPVPEFFRGTMNAPEGWAMVDEKRPEIHTDNKGNIKSFGESGANMRYLDRGDKIYSSRETYFQKELGNILDGNDILPYNQMFDMVAPTINLDKGISKDDFRKEIRGMTSKLMSKETSVVNINKSGFATSIIKGNGKANKMNNVLRLRGGVV